MNNKRLNNYCSQNPENCILWISELYEIKFIMKIFYVHISSFPIFNCNIIITVNYSADRAEILCAPKADAALPWYHYGYHPHWKVRRRIQRRILFESYVGSSSGTNIGTYTGNVVGNDAETAFGIWDRTRRRIRIVSYSVFF